MQVNIWWWFQKTKKKNMCTKPGLLTFLSPALISFSIKLEWNQSGMTELGSNSHHAKAMPGHSCERGQILPHVSRAYFVTLPRGLWMQTTSAKHVLTCKQPLSEILHVCWVFFKTALEFSVITWHLLQMHWCTLHWNSNWGFCGVYHSINTAAAGHSLSVGVCRRYHFWD